MRSEWLKYEKNAEVLKCLIHKIGHICSQTLFVFFFLNSCFKRLFRSWRNSSAGKRTCVPCRGARFHSHHLHGSSQPCLVPVLADLVPSFAVTRHLYYAHIYIHGGKTTYTHKIKHLKFILKSKKTLFNYNCSILLGLLDQNFQSMGILHYLRTCLQVLRCDPRFSEWKLSGVSSSFFFLKLVLQVIQRLKFTNMRIIRLEVLSMEKMLIQSTAKLYSQSFLST